MRIDNILVPSFGRAGVAPSARWLQQVKRRQVIFAVHTEAEHHAYAEAYPWAITVRLRDETFHHDGKMRTELFSLFGSDTYFSVDDDIRLSYKTVASPDDMFDILERHSLAGATMAGIGQQLFSNGVDTRLHNDDYVTLNKFVSTVYAIDPKPYANARINELLIYGDVALIIHAIQYGGGTVASYCATHSNVSPATGGCNSWRTREIIIQDLDAICAMFPDICTKRPTTNTTHSQYIGVGLRVAWSKIKRLS